MQYPLKKLTLGIITGTALGGLFSPAQAQSQAQIYGLQTAKEDKNDLDTQANEFSSSYFG